MDPVKILKTGIAESEEDPFYVVKSEARRPWRPVPNPTADWTNRRERGEQKGRKTASESPRSAVGTLGRFPNVSGRSGAVREQIQRLVGQWQRQTQPYS